LSSIFFENSGLFFHGRLPFKNENYFKSILYCECPTLYYDVFTTFTKISNRIFGAQAMLQVHQEVGKAVIGFIAETDKG